MKRMQAGTDDIVFVAAKRTPFGTFGGSLKNHTATDLAVIASRAALIQSGLQPTDVDQVIFGNVAQTSADACAVPAFKPSSTAQNS
jgi:acetyl-CoA acyltransferase 2